MINPLYSANAKTDPSEGFHLVQPTNCCSVLSESTF